MSSVILLITYKYKYLYVLLFVSNYVTFSKKKYLSISDFLNLLILINKMYSKLKNYTIHFYSYKITILSIFKQRLCMICCCIKVVCFGPM